MLYQSADRGITFQQPVMSILKPDRYTWGNGAVLTDGTYVTPYEELDSAVQKSKDLEQILRPRVPNAQLKVLRSADGGETLSAAAVVSDAILSESALVDGCPSLAVDPSDDLFRDRLYLVWNDYFQGGTDILLASSSDKGKSWSKPVVVNNEEPRNELALKSLNVLPTVAVNREGIVGVLWYDRGNGGDRLGYWVRFAASLDGGETFLPSVTVSEAPASFDLNHLGLDANATGGGDRWYSAPSGNSLGNLINITLTPSVWPGHTAGLASSADGAFQALWVDNRTGVMQIWTSRITVAATAVRNGSGVLADMDDVSNKVTLDFANAIFDRKRRTVTVDAYLANTSSDGILGPVKVRVLSMRAPTGVQYLTLTNPDGGERSQGTVWDFTSVLNGGKLRPGERSRPKHLEFQLASVPQMDIDWITDNAWSHLGIDRVGIVNVDTKILAHLQK
jgi:hypothetical protein